MAFEKTFPIVLKPSKLCGTWLVISQLYSIPEHNTVKVAMCLQVKKAGPRIRDRNLILASSLTSLLSYLILTLQVHRKTTDSAGASLGSILGVLHIQSLRVPVSSSIEWAP